MQQLPVKVGDYYGLESMKYSERKKLKLLSKMLRNFIAEGNVLEDLEDDYNCTAIYDEALHGIVDIKFQNESDKTMFMLKYNV